jgi:hypothetical protein
MCEFLQEAETPLVGSSEHGEGEGTTKTMVALTVDSSGIQMSHVEGSTMLGMYSLPHLVYFAAGTKPPALSLRNVCCLHWRIKTPKVIRPSATIAVYQGP